MPPEGGGKVESPRRGGDYAPSVAERLALAQRAGGLVVPLLTTVVAFLIGGLVVKLGSSMIDTSVRARLAALQNAMKEVG